MLPVSKTSGLMRPLLFSASRMFSVSCASANQTKVPRDADVLIIGGGLVGQATAFFLKREQPNGPNITIVERDPAYKQASSALSAASIRQQFSIPENIKLSLFTMEIIRNSEKYFGIKGQDPIDMCYNYVPYLFLAETDNGATTLEKNVQLQQELGAWVSLIGPAEIKKRYPWLNVENVKLGSIGLDNEGYFDPWSLMTALKRCNLAAGVRYVHGEVEGFELSKSPSSGKMEAKAALVRDLSTKSAQPQPINFTRAIISSGAWSGKVALKLGVGRPDGPEECRTPLPVEPRKRYCYIVHCPKGPVGMNSLMVCDPNGVYFRREGYSEHYLVGGSPLTDADEPPITDLTPDDRFFTETLWPMLATRAPCFEECKLTNSWAGYYDMNPLDHNLIIGPHNYFKNVIFATGLSGHGVMHSLGVGRAVSELVYHNKYKAIDLSRFSFDRVIANKPLWEQTMV